MITSPPGITHALWRGDGTFELVASAGIDLDNPDLTPLPEGFDPWTWIADPATRTFAADLAGCRAKKWEAVKAYRDVLEQTGTAPSQVGAVQCDDRSKIKISGLVQMAMISQAAGVEFSQTFTLADNSNVVLEAPGMIALGVAVGQHILALHARAQELRDEIAAAETLAGIAAIDITAGWP